MEDRLPTRYLAGAHAFDAVHACASLLAAQCVLCYSCGPPMLSAPPLTTCTALAIVHPSPGVTHRCLTEVNLPSSQVGRHPTTYAAQNTVGLLFFEALFLSFRTLFTALFTFPNEYKMMLKVSWCFLIP